VPIGHEGGDAPHVKVAGRSGVFIADGGEWCAGGDLDEDRFGVEAVRLENVSENGFVAKLGAFDMAGLEECAMQERKALGIIVSNNDGSLKGEEAGVIFGVLPDRCLTFLDMHLAQRKRYESDVPVGAIDDALDDVSMNDAGEGAAVVPRYGELKSHGESQPFLLREEEGEGRRT
jgi:hypothetical protein